MLQKREAILDGVLNQLFNESINSDDIEGVADIDEGTIEVEVVSATEGKCGSKVDKIKKIYITSHVEQLREKKHQISSLEAARVLKKLQEQS